MGSECSVATARPCVVNSASPPPSECLPREHGERICNVEQHSPRDPAAVRLPADLGLRPPGQPSPFLDACTCGSETPGLEFTAVQPVIEPCESVGPTPRGPVPPWVVHRNERAKQPVDLTATGPTPPKQALVSLSLSPPGLPEELEPNDSKRPTVLRGEQLEAAQKLFDHVRNGDANALSIGLRALACMVDPNGRTTEAMLLGILRDRVPPHASLVCVAAARGDSSLVEYLLVRLADPAAQDDEQQCALHHAAMGGNELSALMILDRLQTIRRTIDAANLPTARGETPETLACRAGHAEVTRVLEAFTEIHRDAELRRLGSDRADASSDSRRVVGPLQLMDLGNRNDGGSGTGMLGREASDILLRTVSGNSLVPWVLEYLPQEESEQRRLLAAACCGIEKAEALLMHGAAPFSQRDAAGNLPAFATTALAHRSWRLLRTISGGGRPVGHDDAIPDEDPGFDDRCAHFWETHLSAQTMAATLSNAAPGGEFKLLLTVLWLFTRESWLFHLIDVLGGDPRNPLGGQEDDKGEGVPSFGGELAGGTGATPLEQGTPSPEKPLTVALSPFARVVQLALNWFMRNGHRHSAAAHRALRLPAPVARRLVEAHLDSHGDSDGKDGGWGGGWCAGTSTFFAASSSRATAVQRCLKSRCNTMLIIRPDDRSPCFPVRMQLKDSDAEDVLYPMGVLFRVVRATRMVSSELASDLGLKDTELASGGAQWPVTVIELAATTRFFESMELLENRGSGFGDGALEALLERCTLQAKADELPEILARCGEVLENCSDFGGTSRIMLAKKYYEKAFSKKTETGLDARAAYRSLLVLARSMTSRSLTGELGKAFVRNLGVKAVEGLEKELGPDHPDTQQARQSWQEVMHPHQRH